MTGPRPWACVLLLGWSSLVCGQPPAERQRAGSCAAGSVLALAAVLGADIAGRTSANWGTEARNLLDVKHLAGELGISVEPVRASADEVIAAGTAWIVHLAGQGTEPHFSLFLGAAAGYARLWDGPGSPPRLVPLAEWEATFTGYAARPAVERRPQQPQLVLEEPLFDLGTVSAGAQVAHVFSLRNAGDAPLELRVDATACGCTLAVLGPNPVPPGGATSLRVEVRLGNEGHFAQHVTVTSNDPYHRLAFLSLCGRTAFAALRVWPATLRITVDADDPGTGRIEVFGPPELIVRAADCVPPVLDLSVASRDELAGMTRYVLRAEVCEWPRGTTDAVLMLTTNRDDEPQIRVPVQLRVRSDWVVEPARLFFGVVPRGERVSQRVVVRRRRGAARPILAPYCDHPLVRVGSGAEEGAGGVSFTVEIVADQPGLLQAAVMVRTDSVAEPVLTVPITALVEDELRAGAGP